MDFVYLIVGIFIGATYPFVWGYLKSIGIKIISFIQSKTK
jgi:hypothetical protein